MEPIGFVSTGDKFGRRGDIALEGLSNCTKVVDDVLVWDSSVEEHYQTVWNVLERFRQYRITINKKKFVFGSPSAHLHSYIITEDGVGAGLGKLKAVADFSVPANITDLLVFRSGKPVHILFHRGSGGGRHPWRAPQSTKRVSLESRSSSFLPSREESPGFNSGAGSFRPHSAHDDIIRRFPAQGFWPSPSPAS